MTESKKNSKKKCSKGMILRDGYKTKKGSKVPSSCIIAQSDSGKKTSLILKKYLKKKAKMHKEAMKRFSKQVPKKCSKGEILREGYKKESFKSHSKTGRNINVSSSWTKPACIKSVTGKSKKGSKLITIMNKDVLGKYGYSNVKSLSKTERHSTLRDAIKNVKPLSVYRRLIALATLNKNKDEELFIILRSDADWIKTQDVYIKSKNIKKISKKRDSKIKSSKKASDKESKKASDKESKKTSKKASDKESKKTSKKASDKESKKTSKN
jgi:hypothetical protein